MPTIIHTPISRVRPDCNWLVNHRRDVTSQIGQDGIIEKIFELIGTDNKFCVEFGAWDGKYLSNTWRLIAEEAWSAFLIEAIGKCREIAYNHPYPRVRALNQLVTLDGEHTFDKTMEREGAPSTIELVSIDIDGNDWHVWNALKKYRPRLVVIEFNPTIPNDVYFVQDADPAVNQGSSLRAMIDFGKEKGYSLVCANGWDAFFVPDALYPLFKIPDNTIDAMYTPWDYETKLFQGYDGTLFTAGCRRLLWANIPFTEDQLQILPAANRRYSDRPD
jgi:hypothetical protein